MGRVENVVHWVISGSLIDGNRLAVCYEIEFVECRDLLLRGELMRVRAFTSGPQSCSARRVRLRIGFISPCRLGHNRRRPGVGRRMEDEQERTRLVF